MEFDQFNAVQVTTAWFPRAAQVLGPRMEKLKQEQVPIDENDRDWSWAERSARLCDDCNCLDDCKQENYPGSGYVGHLRVFLVGTTYKCTGVRPCKYQRIKEEAEKLPWLDKRHAEKTLSGYVVTDANRPAFTACHQYVRDMKRNLVTGKSITLGGSTGVGKTHLASAVFREVVLNAKCTASFLYMPDFIDEIKNRFGERNDQSVQDFIEATMGAKFVVMDNLEFRQVTAWLIDKLNKLVEYRYRLMLPTIVTTGWTAKQMAEALEDKLPSRLIEMGQWFNINDSDYRRKTRRNSNK